ncbi:hypothetical protein L226DRAFT_114346 [Lentinus tigrinus ALCF2SS1-7]|uniref:uncharacterized protein n=1 Tax=Lentinus tigrinus ALCF2SS1-7 TaxID=1328758 RepID=UPI001166330D|nr:hypothetical protein L226DRAFT_114346 [Lentinus tigrinus ALCF2SS1-7]
MRPGSPRSTGRVQTTFNRQEAIVTLLKREIDGSSVDKEKPEVSEAEIERMGDCSSSPLPDPPSYPSQLKIWHELFSDEIIFKIFLRPFPFLISPVTRFLFLSRMQTVWLSGWHAPFNTA